MRISLAFTASVVLITGILAIPTAAAATTGREAVQICNRRPACNITVDSGGGIYINYGGRWIYCPGMDGECFVVVRQVPPNRRPTTVRGQMVESILGIRPNVRTPRSPGAVGP